MRVLGIEGTAWAASAAVFDTNVDSDSGTDPLCTETDPYVPDSGGLHPREAAEHMAEAIPRVIERVLDADRERGTGNGDENGSQGIDAVAFSRGPGLGPCLRIVASAARAFALSRGTPLIGVNHMIAHAEIGRDRSGFDAPICLNASGANAHVLGYRNGRYRVLGETMDTGVGNALDKFARYLEWSHPGGPKVEAAAEEGEYLPLPYVVKGMDLSFSGLVSAAKEAIDKGEAIEDVCYSLQETVFAMLTEVAERALSLTDAEELVLGGGVGQNARLQDMLGEMCRARGAQFCAPEPELLRDNAGMIAALGAKMYAAGDTLPVADSRVRPDFRPDEVAVSWPVAEPGRSGNSRATARDPDDRHDPADPGESDDLGAEAVVQGAEAVVEIDRTAGRVVKRRPRKAYRHPALDERLGRERTVLEARLTSGARRLGVPTPVIEALDVRERSLTVGYVGDRDLRDLLGTDGGSSSSGDAPPATAVIERVAHHLATLHGAGIVHGDPTTRNVRVSLSETSENDPPAAGEPTLDRASLIDFGLGYHTERAEDHAMDLHVFGGSLAGTAEDADVLRGHFETAYATVGEERVLDRLREIEDRGRYQ
ncbi:Kae1-associated kinase Bud32 [Halobacteriales archaeon QH_8_64_26]|nr:MAG: Kae1-associated kinase Bud32 [Halobacteriales archaeon QH_8_64_26]